MIRQFGYPEESQKVYAFLKGIGEFDNQSRQTYFTIRDVYKYRQMMMDKQHKGKFEVDFDFHEFFFKCISSND